MSAGDFMSPLVSICCITYNHVKYIRDAIEGFLIQKTTFPFEIIIHDDASTDGTDHIIKEYELKYPNLIFPIYQKENQFSKGVRRILITFVFPKCTGKYIAYCEGDDYWTDPYKLQKQIDFLEANPEYGLCYTNAKVFVQKTSTFSKTVIGYPVESFEELLLNPGIVTLTTVFRRALCEGYSSEVLPYSTKWKMGDYPLWLYIATKSKMKFIEGITATYRRLEESASRSKSFDHNLDFAISAFEIRNFFADKFHVSDAIRKQYSLDFFCNELSLAFLVNRTEVINQSKLFFKANKLIVFRIFFALFKVFRNNQFAHRVLNHFMNRYRQNLYK
jgi:glycosyltransferase involved in cell wall biosynthesis